MKLRNIGAEIFVPDNKPVEEAVARTTYMGISAHQDDIEIMAYDGILKCFGKPDEWFLGVVATNGAGSPRNGVYANYTDQEIQIVRTAEQRKAAFVGEYGAVVFLNYKSSEIKDPSNEDSVSDLKEIIRAARPKVVYTHNLADKHDTHLGTVIKVIKAIREIPKPERPEKIYGCEVWRNLDWVNDGEKVMFDVSAHPNIAAALVEVFDSQICGGKRHDLAAAGRRRLNATYAASHETDKASALSFAMDLTLLIENEKLDIKEYVLGYISRFSEDVDRRLSRVL